MARETLAGVRISDNVAQNGCYACGKDRSDSYGPLISADTAIDGEGMLYLCAQCVLNMGHAVGMLSKPESDALIEQDKAAKRELRTLRMRLGKAEKALKAHAEWKEAVAEAVDATS